jgi:hypothetical protein
MLRNVLLRKLLRSQTVKTLKTIKYCQMSKNTRSWCAWDIRYLDTLSGVCGGGEYFGLLNPQNLLLSLIWLCCINFLIMTPLSWMPTSWAFGKNYHKFSGSEYPALTLKQTFPTLWRKRILLKSCLIMFKNSAS